MIVGNESGRDQQLNLPIKRRFKFLEKSFSQMIFALCAASLITRFDEFCIYASLCKLEFNMGRHVRPSVRMPVLFNGRIWSGLLLEGWFSRIWESGSHPQPDIHLTYLATRTGTAGSIAPVFIGSISVSFFLFLLTESLLIGEKFLL